MKRMFTVGRSAHCPVCNQTRQFYIVGKQVFPKFTLKLWNCYDCGATISTQEETGNTAVLTQVQS